MAMKFAESPRSTVGIEWELQLIDKDSNDLRQCAETVLQQLDQSSPLIERVHREMLLNTVEVISGRCDTVAQGCNDLQAAIELVRPVTDSLRVALASAGTHPFANPLYQQVTDSERYAELVKRTKYWGRQMLLYGTHVHVGIESRDKVLPILNALLTRFAHIQSLAASSPVWAGENTGYASNRAMIFQQLPTAGTSRQFQTWAELERFTADLLKTGVIDSFNQVRWDIRPAPHLGTIEVRVADAATNMQEVAAIAALTHCLVEDFSRRYDAGEKLPTIPDWYVAENKWRSARYGMDAVLILDENGNEEHVIDTVEHMLTELMPVARDLHCEKELAGIGEILRLGAPYQRMQQVADAHGDCLDAVVEYMCAEFSAGQIIDPASFHAQRGLNC